MGDVRIRGLDGLRAMAILAVMGFHSPLRSHVVNGWLGVDVFFVLSGYLITAQLRRAKWTWRTFMWRRVARLWPALAAMCLVSEILVRAGGDGDLPVLLAATWTLSPAILWVRYSHALDYVLHTWSLAVEAQFYAAWAIVMLWGRRQSQRRLLTVICLVAATAYLATFILTLDGRMWWASYAAPTRSMGLMAGAALAVTGGRRLPSWVVWLAGLLLVTLVVVPQPGGAAMVMTVPLGVAATAALVMHLLQVQTGALARWLELPVLRWMGTRSYSAYLWHLPLWGALTNMLPWAVLWTLIPVAAEASYRLIEVPGRRALLSCKRKMADVHVQEHVAQPRP